MPSSPDEPIRVLVVDDHPIVREGLIAVLERQPDVRVVGEAGDGTEAVARFSALRPSVVLLDLRMPGLDGVQALEAIRRLDPAARVLILTTFDGEEDVQRGLRSGAMGYLLKGEPRERLLEAVRAVHAGRKFVPAAVAEKLVDAATTQELTPREREILQQVALGRSNKEIGAALGITTGTVKTHVNSILAKLGAAGRTEAVYVAVRRGLIHLA